MERTTVHWVLTVVCTCISVMQVSSAAPTLGTCGQPNEDVCSYFFNALESAFVASSDVPYALQRAFFPTGTISPLLLDVHTTVTVTNIPNVNCTDEIFLYRSSSIRTLPPVNQLQLCTIYNCTSMSWRWTHQWSRTVINFVIERENLNLLQDVNFIAYATAAFNAFDTGTIFNLQRSTTRENSTSFDTGTLINFFQGSNTRENSTSVQSSEVHFSLIIPSLHCIPSEDALLEAWGDILPWLELYAVRRADIEQLELDVEHRGYAYLQSGATPTDGILLPVLTAGQVLMNIAIALIIMRLVTAYYANLSDSENQSVVSIYWANFFLACLANAVLILGNVVLYIGIGVISDISPNALGYRIISDGTTLGLVLLELIVAVFTPKNDKLYIPFIISQFICCCQCCKCCGNESGLAFLRKSIHTFAIWVLMVFLQLVAASIVPVIIVCLGNPVPSIAFITLMASTLFCLVIFVAHLIHISERMKESTAQERFTLMLQAFVFLVFFGIVSLVIILYLTFVRAGTSTGTLEGIFLSLVPSAIISAVAWYTKSKLLSSENKKPGPNKSKRVGSFIKRYADAFHKILQSEDEELLHDENPENLNIPYNKSDDREKLDIPEDVKLDTDVPDAVILDVQNAQPNESQDKTSTDEFKVVQNASFNTDFEQSPEDAYSVTTNQTLTSVILNVPDAKPNESQEKTFTLEFEDVQNASSNTDFEQSPEDGGTVTTDKSLTSEMAITTRDLEIEVVVDSDI